MLNTKTRQTESNDGTPRKEEPVKTAADRTESIARGANSARSISNAGLQYRYCKDEIMKRLRSVVRPKFCINSDLAQDRSISTKQRHK